MLYAGELLINDDPIDSDLIFDPVVEGETMGMGCIPRDYSVQPVETFAPPSGIVIIPRSEWSDRIKEKDRLGSHLSQMRLRANNGGIIDALDQNGQGYCWSYSGTSAVMMLRMMMNAPLVRLSGHANACILKSYRDEGGWGALGLERAMSHGIPSVAFWKEKSMARSNDTPATWENAKLHKVDKNWVDLARDVYDRNLKFDMIASLLLSNVPIIGDFNWWSHSVCLIDLVETEPGSFGVRILNSWTNSWSEQGCGVLAGSKAIPDGAVCPLTVPASLV